MPTVEDAIAKLQPGQVVAFRRTPSRVDVVVYGPATTEANADVVTWSPESGQSLGELATDGIARTAVACTAGVPRSQGDRERSLFPVGTRVRHRSNGVRGTVIATAPVSVEWDNGPRQARIANALHLLAVDLPEHLPGM
jgi:hypothetical protein